MKLASAAAFALLATSLSAQVSSQRLLNSNKEPQNWLMYSGNYSGLRYSLLDRITPANANQLELEWVFQTNSVQKMEATPLVVDGVMYATEPPNDIVALDAKSGRVFWTYQYTPATVQLCCGQANRGLAILGDTLYMGTIDAHLQAIDAKNGRLLWDVKVADESTYSITEAPLIVKDKIILGVAGGEEAIRGFVAAYSPENGDLLWKFNTVPGPGEPGHDTWPGDTWQHGGGSSWMTGSYDPGLNLVFWGIGNPYPDLAPELRQGDNLYTNSALAIDPDTGKLKWYFQFTPNDGNDWDSMQVPVLAETEWNGAPRKVIYWANRNGFFYVLDRATGKFLRGNAFVKQTWATGLDQNGRPIRSDNSRATVGGTKVYPGTQGGTNWYSPSYSPRTGLFYVSAWEDYFNVMTKLSPLGFTPGGRGQGFPRSPLPSINRGAINTWTDQYGHGELKAIDPKTGQTKWAFKMNDVSDSGILTTASDMLFTANREGYFLVLNARDGTLLWKATLGAQISSAPVTYMIDGKQYVALSAGHALFVFGLRE
ncbi:MAG TPA: PQQ-dependent dehydrogenase, methanol/ethanol family [Candidatus Acidoferrum sp.]|nr:PQQ-dependent dehydrogenase, methanol/ethanol family [Candidatus Acidoferrum sp.]